MCQPILTISKSLNEYTKNKLIVPAKNEYIRKIDEIESNPEALKAIISAPDYFLDSYKKARLVGRVIKILVDEYGLVIDKKYNKFVEVYYNELLSIEMHWDMQCVVMSMQIEKFLLVR